MIPRLRAVVVAEIVVLSDRIREFLRESSFSCQGEGAPRPHHPPLIRHTGPRIRNYLPHDLKVACSLSVFIRKMKSLLIKDFN